MQKTTISSHNPFRRIFIKPTLLKHKHVILFNNNANGFISFQKLQFFFASSFFPSDAVDGPSLKGNPTRNRHFASINTQYYSIIMLMASFPFKNSNFSLHHLSCQLMLCINRQGKSVTKHHLQKLEWTHYYRGIILWKLGEKYYSFMEIQKPTVTIINKNLHKKALMNQKHVTTPHYYDKKHTFHKKKVLILKKKKNPNLEVQIVRIWHHQIFKKQKHEKYS